MGVILAVMFVGVTVASQALGLRPFDPAHVSCAAVAQGNSCEYQSVIAQLAVRAFGSGSLLFVVVAIATTLILILAANTSFSDFPRLLFFLARDDYAPHQFGRLGDRLAYSNGILVLGLLAIAPRGDLRRQGGRAHPAVRRRCLPRLHHVAGRAWWCAGCAGASRAGGAVCR